MLDKSFATDVPDFNGFIQRARGDAGAIGVELHAVDGQRVVSKSLDQGFGSDIPKFDLLVLRTRYDESGICRKLS